MHVDGFRFDLAAFSAAARRLHPHCAFLDALGQDPALGAGQLIAEPWDIGFAGYGVGAFPRAGASGTAATATPCASSGAGRAASRRPRHPPRRL